MPDRLPLSALDEFVRQGVQLNDAGKPSFLLVTPDPIYTRRGPHP